MKTISKIMISILTMGLLTGCMYQQDNTTDQEVIQDTSNQQTTEMTITGENVSLEGYLENSEAAQSFINQLPYTVSLNDSDNDFCGGSIDITYQESDVVSGYKNGDIMYWVPGHQIALFVDDEESSQNIDGLVKLGHITSSQEELDALEGTLELTFQLKVQEEESMRIKITAGNQEMYATLEDNVTSQALLQRMPFTITMDDLYNREMCYRYGAGALPTEELRSDGYEIGDIAYWPPRGSLVILYDQNGEQFERVHLGHIESGVESFNDMGQVDVTFERVE